MHTDDSINVYLSLWEEHGGSPGLAHLTLNDRSGRVEREEYVDRENSFGCSCFDPRRNILYVCNEIAELRGLPYETGRVFGYRVSPEDGSLNELFRRETLCPNPAYVSLDPSGKYLLIAHHSCTGAISHLRENHDGSFSHIMVNREAPLVVFELDESGTPNRIVDVKKHPVDPDSRPYGTYQHCCVFSPDGKFVAVCDKGDGRIYLYSFNSDTGKLTLCSSTLTDSRGMHPRYCVFHPTLPVFVINHEKEHDHRMIVSSFRYDENGQVEKISAVNILSDDEIIPARAHYEQQGLAISEDGKTVYTCVNGPNFIGVLSVDETGALAIAQRAPVSGTWPRGLALVPGGRWLLSSCLVSGDVMIYSVDRHGLLGKEECVAKIRGGSYFAFS